MSSAGDGAPRRDRRRASPRWRAASPGRPCPTSRAGGARPMPSTLRPAATRSHSVGDGCSRNRWTSRHAATASSTASTLGASRVSPNSDTRSGRSRSWASARSALAGRSEPLGRARRPDALAQQPPQRRLPGEVGGQRDPEPVDVVAGRPAGDHRRAVHAVAVEQVGEVAGRGEPPGLRSSSSPGAAEVRAERGHPRRRRGDRR